eukprot:scaffold16007_cov65-Phaeocystis_antarctica.AAC.5
MLSPNFPGANLSSTSCSVEADKQPRGQKTRGLRSSWLGMSAFPTTWPLRGCGTGPRDGPNWVSLPGGRTAPQPDPSAWPPH